MTLLSINKNIGMILLQNINGSLQNGKLMSFNIYSNKSDIVQI